MDSIFRLLFLHMRSFWRRARGLFVSTWFQRLHIAKNAPSPVTHTQRPPTPIPPSSPRTPPTISMARTKVWACRRARKLRAQMKERRKAKKQAMYARIAAVALGKGKERTKVEDEEEEDEEEVQEADAPIPSLSPRRSLPPLQLPHWDAAMSALGLELQLELGYDFPSPTDSSASSGSATTTTGPVTPVTPMTPATPTTSMPPGSFHFPRAKASVASEYPAQPPPTVRVNHLRRDPCARGRFRTLSASITARSPLSLSFPLSFSLPLTVRRASSPSVPLQRCVMVIGGEVDRDGEGGDPFGRHDSGYYAPALGLGDAYDLSAWAWACECSPHRRAKKRVRAATAGSASVYRAPVHAASAPQLTYAQHADVGLEYSRMLANAGAGVAGERPSTPKVVRPPVPTSTNARENDFAAAPRKGMRPLLLPQKLGLLTIGAVSARDSGIENKTERWRADSRSSVGGESRVSGWDVDLERGVWRGGEGRGRVRC
ncbi:hypothetical protein EI94DRAFT_1695799 [Lactarius quietus]|nr:hypothetical protein EI94DRAFT_1695799 [Lactarius quietus]